MNEHKKNPATVVGVPLKWAPESVPGDLTLLRCGDCDTQLYYSPVSVTLIDRGEASPRCPACSLRRIASDPNISYVAVVPPEVANTFHEQRRREAERN